MNDQPKEISNKEVRRDFAKLAPIILGVDLILAVAVLIFSGFLFGENAPFLGTLIAGAFVVVGLFSFFILKMMAKKVTRGEEFKDDLS